MSAEYIVIEPKVTEVVVAKTGVQGPQGSPGAGVPSGGTEGQIIIMGDGVTEWTDYVPYSTTEKNKLLGIEAGAEVNNIADADATDLTDGEDTTLHTHDGRYYTELEVRESEFSMTNKTLDDITNKIGADHIHYKVRNGTGVEIPVNTIVRASATQPGTDYILIEAVTDPQTQIAIGITHTTLAPNGTGLVTNTGVVSDYDTEDWIVGTVLYPDAAGGLTPTQPTVGSYQTCAYVLRQHQTQGTLLVEFTEPKQIASTTQPGYVQLNDTLTSDSDTEALTAKQGKSLAARIMYYVQATPPSTLLGMQWFDTMAKALMIYNGQDWERLHFTSFSPTILYRPDDYAVDDSSNMVLSNQGSELTTYDLLLNSGRGFELDATQYVDIPIHHELTNFATHTFDTDNDGWIDGSGDWAWNASNQNMKFTWVASYRNLVKDYTGLEVGAVYRIKYTRLNGAGTELQLSNLYSTAFNVPDTTYYTSDGDYTQECECISSSGSLAFRAGGGNVEVDDVIVDKITNENSFLTYQDLTSKTIVTVDNSLNTPSTTYRFTDGTYNNILVDKTEWDATDKAKIEANPNLVGKLALSETGSIDELNKTLDEDDAWYPGMEKYNGFLINSRNAENKITNSDFRDGTTTGWTARNAILTVVDFDGSKVMKVADDGVWSQAQDTFTTDIGKTYKLFVGLAKQPTPASLNLSIDIYDNASPAEEKGNVASYTVPYAALSETKMTYFTYNLTAQTTTTTVAIRSNTTDYVLADNIFVFDEEDTEAIANYTQTVRDNADFQTSGLQTTAFVRDALGVPTAYDDTALNFKGDGYGDTQWNPSLETKFWLEEIVDGVIYQHNYDGTNLTTYTDNVAGTPTAHSPENADYIFGKGVYPKVTADPYTESVHIPVGIYTTTYDSYNQAERYTILSEIAGA